MRHSSFSNIYPFPKVRHARTGRDIFTRYQPFRARNFNCLVVFGSWRKRVRITVPLGDVRKEHIVVHATKVVFTVAVEGAVVIAKNVFTKSFITPHLTVNNVIECFASQFCNCHGLTNSLTNVPMQLRNNVLSQRTH